MKYFLIPFCLLLSGCPFLNFDSKADCLLAVEEVIVEKEYNEIQAAAARALGDELCINSETLEDLIDVKNALEAIK